MLLFKLRWSKIGLVSLDTPENRRLWILLIFVQNECEQLKHKQTLKQALKIGEAI